MQMPVISRSSGGAHSEGHRAAAPPADGVEPAAAGAAGPSPLPSGTRAAVRPSIAGSGAREATARERPQHAKAVQRGQLLALFGGPRVVVHGHLEDPLAALDQPRGDLGLDREAGLA